MSVVGHGSGLDDLLIPLVVVGIVVSYAFGTRRRRRAPKEPPAAPSACPYCDAPLSGEARCSSCGFRVSGRLRP